MFCKPGFETTSFRLNDHRLPTLWPESAQQVIDARPRIVAQPDGQLQPHGRLVDLEHVQMRRTMLIATAALNKPGQRQGLFAKAAAPSLNAASWWSLAPADALLTALLPQHQPFRKDSIPPPVDLLLRPNEDGDDIELVRLLDVSGGRRGEKAFLVVERSQHQRISDDAVQGVGIAPWGETDYLTALTGLAGEMDMALDKCALRFGAVSVPDNDNGWCFHPVLGFVKAES